MIKFIVGGFVAEPVLFAVDTMSISVALSVVHYVILLVSVFLLAMLVPHRG